MGYSGCRGGKHGQGGNNENIRVHIWWKRIKVNRALKLRTEIDMERRRLDLMTRPRPNSCPSSFAVFSHYYLEHWFRKPLVRARAQSAGGQPSQPGLHRRYRARLTLIGLIGLGVSSVPGAEQLWKPWSSDRTPAGSTLLQGWLEAQKASFSRLHRFNTFHMPGSIRSSKPTRACVVLRLANRHPIVKIIL